ncbi:GGDEF domain-containing protein [Deinococcus hohokamensis]|uniref:GGDEF domain-containing protein n=1 Tax=Deinococcus hohokamensis TaxID=309883 RepID=A0ABV9I9B5_9DEIO
MRDPTVLAPEDLTANGRPRPARPGASQLELPLVVLGVLAQLVWPAPTAAAFDRVALPVLLGVLVTMNLAATRALLLPPVLAGAVAMVGAWAYVLAKLALLLATVPAAEQLGVLLPLLPWIPALLVAHTWRLPRPYSGALSAAALGALLLLSAGAALGGQPQAAAALAQLVLACGVLLTGQHTALDLMRRQARRGAWAGLSGAHRDALTGLPDRATMQRALSELATRHPGGLAVATVRIDHTERLSAERGEAFVERLTAHVARTLVESLRDDDLVGCHSPRQFVLLLRLPDARAGRAACERLRVRVASRPVEGVNPSISVGLAHLSDVVDLALPGALGLQTLTAAERALNELSDNGFNRVQLSTAPLPAPQAS